MQYNEYMQEESFETLFKNSLDEKFNEEKKFISSLSEDEFLIFLEKKTFFDEKFFPSHFKDNRKVVLGISKKTMFSKSNINELINFNRFKYDIDVVKNILDKNPMLVELIPIEILKLDDEMIHSLCRKGLFKLLPEEMKKQEKFFKTAFDNDVFVITNSAFHNDLNYINKIKNLGFIYSNLSEELKNDKELAIKALNDNFTVYGYMSEMLKKDIELAWLALKKSTYVYQEVVKYFPDNKEMFDYCIKKALIDSSNSFGFLSYANKNFLKDIKIAREILSRSGNAYLFDVFSDEIKDDDVCASLAISQESKNFQYVSERLKQNNDIIELAFLHDKCNAYVFSFLPQKYKSNKEFVKKVLGFVKYGHLEIIKEVSDEIKDDILLIYPYIKDSVYAINEKTLSKRIWGMVEFLKNDEKLQLIKTLFLKQDLPRVLEEPKVNKKIKI